MQSSVKKIKIIDFFTMTNCCLFHESTFMVIKKTCTWHTQIYLFNAYQNGARAPVHVIVRFISTCTPTFT